MPLWVRVLAIAAGGAVLGAIALSLLTVLFYAIFAPDALKDGQFAMVFLATVPLGAMLGGVAAASLALLAVGKAESAGWVNLLGGGLIAGLVLSLTVLWTVSQPGAGIRDFFIGLVYPGYGSPFVWAVALMVWGVRLLRRP